MKDKFSLNEFWNRFPDGDSCLEEIKNQRFPSGIHCSVCNKTTNHYKLKSRMCYSCEFCRNQVYPLAGTIFEKSTTSLKLWFYAMYIMTQTRSGTSAKQLERMLGVTYKTAWRMFKQIRMLMANTGGIEGNGELLDGEIEIDETFIGGKGKNRAFKPNYNEIPKQVVMGMLQRDGKVYLKHIPNTGKWTLLKQIKDNVSPKAKVYTDEWGGYIQLKYHNYNHQTVNHKSLQFVKGDIHTQNIENVWSILKRGVYGVYRVVSKKYLQAYIDEYAWRYNHREYNGLMFDMLLKQVAEVRILTSVQPSSLN
ncbi:MAG: IS1595 family transposase [Candidatus Blackburnbacteria bacterium]|nr:IS1595 family transposase [Candidatus Blackburnbacteria bacterium]